MKKPFFLLAALLLLISVSTIAALTTGDSPTDLEEDYCIQYHGKNFLIISPSLNYGGAALPGEELVFSMAFYVTKNGMIFNATVELTNFPEELSLNESQSVQNKSDMNYNSFTPAWRISSNAEGNITFSIKSTVTIKYILYHTNLNSTSVYQYNATFQVLEDSTEPPYLIGNLPGEGIISPPINWKIILGQMLGIFSTILVYLCIQLGIPERRAWIRKKSVWSDEQLRKTHCDLGYLATATIVLHNIFLSLSTMWGNYFKWYQFYPTFYVYKDGWNDLSLGLDLAVFGSLIFIIATIMGAFFQRIAKRLGYRTAIFTQQISYLALFFSVIHAILNGSWTKNSPILMILQILMLFELIISRLRAYFNSRYLKKKRKINSISDHLNKPDQKLIKVSQDNINKKIKLEEEKPSLNKRSL